MKIADIYKSVQGEGFLTGTESIFVRAGACNLRCRFCDTVVYAAARSASPEARSEAYGEKRSNHTS